MKFKQIIAGLNFKTDGKIKDDYEISSIGADSRKVLPGGLFVALPGPKTHGAKYINDAVRAGAKAIAASLETDFAEFPAGILSLRTPDPVGFLAGALKNFNGDLSSRIRLAGVTGTNGKTTITYLLESLLAAADRSCGVIGTVNHRFGNRVFKAGNTTPGLVEIYDLLGQMSGRHVDFCAMEVSSHALDQRRVEGLDFRYAIFTNLTSDHLDYHKDRETYFLAKSKLFTSLGSGARAIINIDDEFGPRLKTMTPAPVWTYGLKGAADFTAENIELGFEYSCFELKTPAGTVNIRTSLIGIHNIYNILSAAAVGAGENLPLDIMKKGIESLAIVPGRLERINAGQDFFVFVDYAHTEDALKNVLSSLRAVKKAAITVVFGCGGDRDKSKRPKMAAMAESLADFCIVTTDNPRGEEPSQILSEIARGFKKEKYRIVQDRREAIEQALKSAAPGDVVLIAGKGHEDYQIFKDQTVPFDERTIVREILTSKES